MNREQPTTDSPIPWYKRSIAPDWLPGWLGMSLLISIAFAVIFGLALEAENPWLVALCAGLAGFALALVILSAASFKYHGQKPNPIAPPDIVRFPIVTFMVILVPTTWVADRQILRRVTYGTTFVTGTLAEVLGLLVLVSIVSAWAVLVRGQRIKIGKILPSRGISLLVAAGALVYALFSVIRYRLG